MNIIITIGANLPEHYTGMLSRSGYTGIRILLFEKATFSEKVSCMGFIFLP
ncbi:MAG: hypothetical protein K6F64_05800 [Clostridia bacterium]|nr:hypothetical protein [Clostridia bacterium]